MPEFGAYGAPGRLLTDFEMEQLVQGRAAFDHDPGVPGEPLMKHRVLGLVLASLAACATSTTVTPDAGHEDAGGDTASQGALASVRASGPTDIWAAGGNASKSIILHSDGRAWTPVVTGIPSFVWWIYGTSAHDKFAVGNKGLIWQYDGADWTSVPSPTTTSNPQRTSRLRHCRHRLAP